MNKLLKPTFNLLLELEASKIDYWVIGGISVAAYHGKFFRENGDIDIFVLDYTFDDAKRFLITKLNCDPETQPASNGRRKLEVKNQKLHLTITSAKIVNDVVHLGFKKDPDTYPKDILERQERNISGYKFITPTNQSIKKIFLGTFRGRQGWKENINTKRDAEKILTKKEFKYFFS